MSEERLDEKTDSSKKSEAEEKEESKLLAGKYASVEELEKGYAEAQNKIGESGADLRRFGALKAQVEAMGLQIDDDGNMRYVASTPDLTDDDNQGEDVDAKVARLEKGLAEMSQTLDVATRSIASTSKQLLLSNVPEGSKTKAAEIYDEMLGRVPARQRLDKGTQDAVRRVVIGQLMEEGAFNIPATTTDDPVPGGKTVNLGKIIPETSRPSTGSGTQKATRLTGSAKEAHEGLSKAMKDMGVEMTEAETADGIEAVRQRRRSVE